MKTPATRGRSAGFAVSFSTIEAEGDGFSRARQRQVRRARRPFRRQRLFHRAMHPRQQLLTRVAHDIEIGVRQQGAFDRLGVDHAIERRRGIDQRDDLGAGQAFGDGELVAIDLAAVDQVGGASGADIGGEFIFAGFELTRRGR